MKFTAKAGGRKPTSSSLILLLGALCCSNCMYGEGGTIGFEDSTTELPGWIASAKIDQKSIMWKAVESEKPFTFAISSDKPHSGLNCLELKFSEEATGPGLVFPEIKASGPRVEIRFFVKAQGMSGLCMLNVHEYGSNRERLKINREVVKFPVTGEWTEVVGSLALHPETTVLRMGIAFMSPVHAGSEFWLDSIEIKNIDP